MSHTFKLEPTDKKQGKLQFRNLDEEIQRLMGVTIKYTKKEVSIKKCFSLDGESNSRGKIYLLVHLPETPDEDILNQLQKVYWSSGYGSFEYPYEKRWY